MSVRDEWSYNTVFDSDPKDAPMKEMTELNAKALLDESTEKPNLNDTIAATDAGIDKSDNAKDANNGIEGALLDVKEKFPDEDEGKSQPLGVVEFYVH